MNEATIRGLARRAARAGRPLGHAYREDCRAYPIPAGSFAAYLDAYDAEREALRDTMAPS